MRLLPISAVALVGMLPVAAAEVAPAGPPATRAVEASQEVAGITFTAEGMPAAMAAQFLGAISGRTITVDEDLAGVPVTFSWVDTPTAVAMDGFARSCGGTVAAQVDGGIRIRRIAHGR